MKKKNGIIRSNKESKMATVCKWNAWNWRGLYIIQKQYINIFDSKRQRERNKEIQWRLKIVINPIIWRHYIESHNRHFYHSSRNFWKPYKYTCKIWYFRKSPVHWNPSASPFPEEAIFQAGLILRTIYFITLSEFFCVDIYIDYNQI